MAYEMKVYDLPGEREYEFKYRGRYGARGEKRAKKARITSEYQQKLNQKNKEKNMRRLIKLNFKKGDLWVTLKYPAGQKRKSIKEVQSDRTAFVRRLRAEYKKAGVPLKFIYRMEIGKLGGIHLHFIINAIPGSGELIRQAWECGHVNFEYLYEDGGFEALAEYVTKPAQSDTGQMVFDFEGMEIEDKKAFMRYGCSRNLVRPVPEVRTFSHWTMRAVLDKNGDPKPSPGYYIDKNTIRLGINPFTGYSYLYYTERELKPFRERRKFEGQGVHRDFPEIRTD